MNNFEKYAAALLAAAFAVALPLAGCAVGTDGRGETTSSSSTERPDDDNDVTQIEDDGRDSSDYKLSSSENGTYEYTDGTGTDTLSFTVTYESGSDNCYSVSGNTLTFSGITEDSVYAITGTLPGNIVVDVDDYELELDFTGFTLTSCTEVPLYVKSGDKFTLLAKKDTENYIYDNRDEVSSEEDVSAAVYALCDLNIQGKGGLYVKSVNNNGIHTKDDLKVKNLNLQVECEDNALKGNDSVTVESGSLVLIARTGDGIKTTNSDISAKGNQRGTITLSGGELIVYAACDGLDAAYDVVICEDAAAPVLEIYTDKYSPYSEEVTATSEDVFYIRFTSTAYSYSIRYFNDASDEIWCNSSGYTKVSAGMSSYYYYPVEKPQGYAYMQLFIYSSAQTQGQNESYLACTDTLTVNENYDTIALQSRGNSLSYGWTNYTTAVVGGMGGMGGMGGISNGNTDKGDYSTKGIKADNAVTISAGNILVSSYDDGVHANADVALENGESPLGNVTVTGGTLTVWSNDDGIHADGTTEITGGTVTVASSYEGIEGGVVKIGGGSVSVTASDDGVNGTSTSGQSIVISGGTLFVYAGGDGLDSNSTSSYNGLLISGGRSVVIAIGSADSSVDTERGYQFTGGYLLGIGNAGGMSSEAVNCQNFSSVGSKATVSLKKDAYAVVTGFVTVKMPVQLNAFVIFLGSTGATVKSSDSTSLSTDANGVCWSV